MDEVSAHSEEASVTIEAPEQETPATAAPTADQQAIEADARRSGWVPKDKWTGNPDKWRDAVAFTQQRDAVLPFIQKENKTLRAKNEALEARLARLEAAEAERAAKQADQTVEVLKFERRQALEAQDHDRVNEIDGKLLEHAVKKAQPAPKQDDQAGLRIWNEWAEDKEWAKDPEMQEIIAEKVHVMVQAGTRYKGAELLDKAAERVKREWPEKFQQPEPRRVIPMADGGGSPGATRNGSIKTWGDLKPEIRAQLDSFTAGMSEADIKTYRANTLKTCAADASYYFR